MATLNSPPIGAVVAALLALAGAWLAARSARLVARGLREGSALDLVRGIRALILSLVAAFFATGVLSGETGFLWIGAIILAEELYETGVLLAVLRLAGQDVEKAPSAPPLAGDSSSVAMDEEPVDWPLRSLKNRALPLEFSPGHR